MKPQVAQPQPGQFSILKAAPHAPTHKSGALHAQAQHQTASEVVGAAAATKNSITAGILLILRRTMQSRIPRNWFIFVLPTKLKTLTCPNFRGGTIKVLEHHQSRCRSLLPRATNRAVNG